MQGVFLDWATVSSRGDVSPAALEEALDGVRLHGVTDPREIGARCAGAEVVLTNKLRIGPAQMDAAPGLQLICLAATGYNNVDLDAARERGIAVCNIRDYCTAAVAQHVFALILVLNQHLAGYQRLLAAGGWRNSPQFTLLDYPIQELAGRTLGIVGLGTLGSAVARLGEAFGMRVRAAQRPGGPPGDDRVPLEKLLAEADVLSLHCPLTGRTRNLIDAAALERMKPDAILINTARGAVVDEAALADALRAGRIGGAGVDVLSEEPPVHGNPLLAGDIPNLIVTPHIAWASLQARQRAVSEMAANITAFRRGERRNRVD